MVSALGRRACVSYFLVITLVHFVLHLHILKKFFLSTERENTPAIISSSWGKQPVRLLLIVPGHADEVRLADLNHSLFFLRKAAIDGHISFHCVVYVYLQSRVDATLSVLDYCEIRYQAGLWTKHMKSLPSLVPYATSGRMKIKQEATHVSVMLDDIDVRRVNITEFLIQMDAAYYDVATAAIPNSYYVTHYPRSHCLSHRTDHADIMFVVFSFEAWLCWQQNINMEINQYGWGYDVGFADICHVKIGVIDTQIAVHDPPCLRNGECKAWSTESTSYNRSVATNQMHRWLMLVLGLSSFEDADLYWRTVAFWRPLTFPYCEKADLLLGTNGYFESTTHRGGWKTIMQHLINNGIINAGSFSAHNSSNSILFIDCIEYWFGWGNKGLVNGSWVGVAHLLPEVDVPQHITRKDPTQVLDYYLESKDFTASAPHCISLITFTADMAQKVKEKLRLMEMEHIDVCVVRHPVSSAIAPFSPESDLPILLHSGAVVLLGQQYRRISTIYRLYTARKKIWLPSRTDSDFIAWITKRENESDPFEVDPSVEIMTTVDFDSYDRMLKQNIIVLDFWAAAANNAVMEGIGAAAPFFVKRLPGPVEYLGEAYPLFFDTVEEVENMISDEVRLEQLLLAAHEYLLAREDHQFSLESFGTQVHTCVLKGLEKKKKNTLPVQIP